MHGTGTVAAIMVATSASDGTAIEQMANYAQQKTRQPLGKRVVDFC